MSIAQRGINYYKLNHFIIFKATAYFSDNIQAVSKSNYYNISYIVILASNLESKWQLGESRSRLLKKSTKC